MVVLDKNIFIDSLTKKNFAQAIGLSKAQEIVAKYPAFNSAYLIESVLLNEENKALFTTKLPVSAIHVRNRVVLHDLIYKQKPTPKTDTISISENEEILDKKAVIAEENIKLEAQKREEEVEAKKLAEAETQRIAQEAKEQKVAEEAKRLAQETVTKESEVSLEEEIIEEVQEAQEEVEAKPKEKVKIPTEENKDSKKTSTKKLITKQEEKVKSLVNQEEFKQKENPKIDFLEWLKSQNNSKTQKISNKPKKEVQAKKIEVEKEDLVPFERTSAIEAEMHIESKQSSDPLDSFISSEILRKQRQRKEKKQSISNAPKAENTVIVSETLAEILTLQQKYNEAIEVYSLLSLKYPQKSIYFATQIEKIKNYL